jgi:hypothetical protein
MGKERRKGKNKNKNKTDIQQAEKRRKKKTTVKPKLLWISKPKTEGGKACPGIKPE